MAVFNDFLAWDIIDHASFADDSEVTADELNPHQLARAISIDYGGWFCPATKSTSWKPPEMSKAAFTEWLYSASLMKR